MGGNLGDLQKFTLSLGNTWASRCCCDFLEWVCKKRCDQSSFCNNTPWKDSIL